MAAVTLTAAAVPARGGPGAPSTVPPPSVPLTFLAASGIGTVVFAVAAVLAADLAVVAPTHPGVVSAVHALLLGVLTVGVLGALHQFAPVVGGRPLRSVTAARLTALLILPGVWVLAGGFAHGPGWLVPAGGSVTTTAIVLAAWNLSGPLSARARGVPVAGLRLSVGFLVGTAAFGIVYAFDRNAGWFPLLPHRVLAHAHLGLLGWLGLSYVAVAEKLWPMFLLAHRPGARSGPVAVALLGTGAPVLAAGLLFDVRLVVTMGAAVVVGGLGAHLASLIGVLRARRRPLELLHAFVIASAASLVVAVVAGIVAGVAPLATDVRARVVAVEVLALGGWLALALVGHAHKVVPFIAWTRLRATGVATNREGGPLLFANLYRHRAARATFALAVAGWAAELIGLLLAAAPLLAAGAVGVGAAGATATWNLATGTRWARAAR